MCIDLTKKAKGLLSKTCRQLISELHVVSKDRGVPENDLASWSSSGDFLRIPGGGDGPHRLACHRINLHLHILASGELAFRGRFLSPRQRPPGAIHTVQLQIPLPAEHSRPRPIKVGPSALLRSTPRREYIKCHVCEKDIFKVQTQRIKMHFNVKNIVHHNLTSRSIQKSDRPVVPLEHPETGQMQRGYNMAGGSNIHQPSSLGSTF